MLPPPIPTPAPPTPTPLLLSGRVRRRVQDEPGERPGRATGPGPLDGGNAEGTKAAGTPGPGGLH
eukprot:9353311-Lingulodinium_polyedra.AAC.1